MPPKTSTTELGSTGLNIWSGTVQEEFLKTLQGSKAVKVFTEMRDNDPLVGAVLFAIDQLIKQVDWKTHPPSDAMKEGEATRDAQEVAEFVEDCFTDMDQSWSETVSEILSMLVFGWSYHELVYKQRLDGRIGWAKWPIRSQESLLDWDVNENGTILGMTQQAPPLYQRVYLPIQKCLLFRTSVHKNNPEGRSLLRNAYRPWFYKKNIEEIEAIGIERDLAGLPVMYLPVDVMKDDAPDWMKAIYEQAKELVVNIRRDSQEGVILPHMVDPDTAQQTVKLELLTSGGARSFDTSQIIERYDRRIAMTVLADFIMLGHNNVGSFALSSDKTDIFAVTLGAILRNIKDVVNKDAIPRLMRLNGIPEELWPTVDFGDIENQSIIEVGNYIQSLVAAGIPLFPDEGLAEYLLGLANLPKPKHSLQQIPNERNMAPSEVPVEQGGTPDPVQAALLEAMVGPLPPPEAPVPPPVPEQEIAPQVDVQGP